MEALIGRLMRRVQHVVVLARSTMPMNTSGSALTAQLMLQPDAAVVDDIVSVGQAGLMCSSPAGTDHVCVAVGGDRTKLVSVGTNNQVGVFKNLLTGETVVFDYNNGMSILLGQNGVAVNCGGKPLTFTNSTLGRFEFPIESTGEVKAMCDGAFVTLSAHKGHSGGGEPPTPNS